MNLRTKRFTFSLRFNLSLLRCKSTCEAIGLERCDLSRVWHNPWRHETFREGGSSKASWPTMISFNQGWTDDRTIVNYFDFKLFNRSAKNLVASLKKCKCGHVEVAHFAKKNSIHKVGEQRRIWHDPYRCHVSGCKCIGFG